MKRIEFNNQIYECPESWSDCTLGQIINTGVIDELIPNAPIVSVISGYVGIPTQDIISAKAKEVGPILELLSFIDQEYKAKSKNEFTFSGQTYSCPPDITDMRFDSWVSAQTVLYNNRDNPVKGLPKVLASLCLKEGESIDQVDLDKRGELFMDLPLTIARDVEGFFLDSQRESQALSQLSSLIVEQEKLIPKQLEELISIIKKRKAHRTSNLPMRVVCGIYLNYLKSFQHQLAKSYNS